MNAKDTIKAVKSCKTLQDLQQFSQDPRKSVRSAFVSRQNELLKTSEIEENEITPAPTDPGTNSGSKGSNNSLNHNEFYKKIPFGCRASNIISFAKVYFGDLFDSADHEKGTALVVIKLTDGSVLNCRGL